MSQSQSQPGVSAADVANQINQLRAYIDSEIKRLENQMINLANQVVSAIKNQTEHLSSDMNKQTIAVVAQAVMTYKMLNSTRDELVGTRKQLETDFQDTRKQLATDFQETRDNLSLKTEADLQLELTGKVSSTIATKAKIESFVINITNRFEKSIEGIFQNRQLYNLNFHKIYEEYTNKIRTIARHIYDIVENDFVPATKAATIPVQQLCDLPMEVDLLRIKIRSESLDESIELLKATRLDAILLSQSKLETSLENKYRISSTATDSSGEYFVHGVFVRTGSSSNLILESRIEPQISANAENLSFTAPANDFARYHDLTIKTKVSAEIAKRGERQATAEEKNVIILAAKRLMTRGKISTDSHKLLDEFLKTNLLTFAN